MNIRKPKNQFITVLTLCITSLFIASCGDSEDIAITKINEFIAQQNVNVKNAGWKRNLPKPPKVTFSKDKEYFWHMRTNKGNIVIKLFNDIAPMHASSTIYLTKLGFYDDLSFHRVITGFMAQGGDPMGNGMGGPGYLYAGEFDNKARHNKAGILSMANRGEGTDGSQFFITFTATPHLDDKHTVFGEVVEGMDVLKIIEKLGSYSGKTKEPLKIKSATISVK
jgi:peptidyl-prolyl cis-trans isomerase B (cyclophilin B)